MTQVKYHIDIRKLPTSVSCNHKISHKVLHIKMSKPVKSVLKNLSFLMFLSVNCVPQTEAATLNFTNHETNGQEEYSTQIKTKGIQFRNYFKVNYTSYSETDVTNKPSLNNEFNSELYLNEYVVDKFLSRPVIDETTATTEMSFAKQDILFPKTNNIFLARTALTSQQQNSNAPALSALSALSANNPIFTQGVPEPLSIMGVSTALGFGILFKKRGQRL